jgi:hypothetical protein
MRITESQVSLWAQLRAEEASSAERERRVDDARQADAEAIVAKLNVLDTDHDGWIDEDDLPYDQLLLLERHRAAEPAAEQAVEQAPPAPAPAADVPPAAEARPPRAEPAPAADAEAAARIDLLA